MAKKRQPALNKTTLSKLARVRKRRGIRKRIRRGRLMVIKRTQLRK